MNVFAPGSYEPSKCAVHRGIGLLAALCCLYNTLAYLERQEQHLAGMALFYGSLAAFEGYVCRCHATKKL